MRTYELRAYTLVSHAALEHYRTDIYPRHLVSFAHHDIGLHGLWTTQGGTPTLYVLISFSATADPDAVTEQVMNSAEFRTEIDGFDPSTIVEVTTTRLTPSAGSPLL